MRPALRPTVILDDLSRDEIRALVDLLRERHRIDVDPVDLLRIRSDTLWARAGAALRQYGDAAREPLGATSAIIDAKSRRALDRATVACMKASHRASRQLASYKRLTAEHEAIDRHIQELSGR